MLLRLWLLVLLVCVSVFAPSRAEARAAENRTWVFLPTVTETRLETEPQVAGTHQENGLWNYEHAPGCTQAAENVTSPILQTQRQLSQLVNKQGAVVDRWLATSGNRWAQTYRAHASSNPNFAKGIRGRVLDSRMRGKFRDMFGDVPGVRIDQTIPGAGNALRPDLYFPNLGGRRVIFDVGGPSKVGDISKYGGMADDLIPLIPEQWF